MSTATRDTTDKVWKLTADLGTITSANVTKTVKLATAGTYVDEDIWVSATAKTPGAATLGASATGEATITTATVGTKADGAYPITGSASISGTASATTTKAGYAASSLTGSGSTTGTASLDATIPAAAATVKLSGTAASPTVAIDAANDNILASAATTTKPTSGYYAAVKATAPATTLSATKTVNTAGYLGVNSEISASGATTAKTGVDYYVPITAGALDNKATTDVTYTENTSVVIPSEGALYINEGYYPAIKITLDQMLDGSDDTAGIATADIRTGQVAYNVDGKKLTGTMGNATVTSGAISASAVTPSYNSTNGNFDVAVTATAAAPTVGSTGYISSSVGTKNTNSTVTSSATLAKVALSTTKTSGNLTVAPTLARTAKPSADTWTDAANGAATTTKPTSGAYVQIDAAAATNTLKVKPTVATAGYGDTTNYGFTEYSASVGAAKATTAYVPIKSGSRGALTSTPSATANITLGTGVTTQPSSGYYIKAHSATSEAAGSTGWTAHGARTASGDIYYPVNTAELTHSNTATETAVAVSASGTRSSNLAAPGTDTTYYVTISASQTAAGSVSHAASVSEGYVPAAGLSTSATIPTSASITGNGGKVYLKSSAITGSVTAALAGATTGYSAPVTVSASTTVPQLKLTGNGSATSGAVYTGTANAANKYINYYTGAYSIE